MKNALSYLFVPVLWILAGCSTFRTVNKFIDKKFEKAGLELKQIETENFHIQYWDNSADDRPVFLILHGFGATAKYQWFKQLEVLEKEYRIVIPNLMYFGESRPKQDRYGLNDQLNLIQELLTELKISKFTLMGASYGGLLSMELTHKYPSQVEKLIIVDAPIKYMYDSDNERVCTYFGEEKPEDLFVPTEPVGMRKLLHLTRGKKTFVPKFILEDFHHDFYSGDSRQGKVELMKNLIASQKELESREYSVSIPVLLVWGETDIIIPPDRGELLNNHLGETSELHILKNGGHMPNLNKSRKFNRLLEDFLVTSE